MIGVTQQSPVPAATRSTRWAISVALLAMWLVLPLTLRPLAAEAAQTAEELNILGMAKLAARLASFGLLALAAFLLSSDLPRRAAAKYLLPFGLFLAWGAVSVFWSALPSVTLGQVFSLGVLWLLAVVLALAYEPDRDASRLSAHACWALLLFSGFLLGCYLLNGRHSGDPRFAFVYAHPTNVSAAASIGIILSMFAATVRQWRWAWQLLPAALACHGLVLYLAHARTAVVLTAVIVAAMWLLYGQRLLVAAASVAGSLAVLGWLLFDPGLDTAQRTLLPTAHYIQRKQTADQLLAFSGREEMWRTMWKSYRESPWVGHGYFVTSRQGELFVWLRRANFDAHNMVLQSLVTTGLIGCGLFLLGVAVPTLRACGDALGRHPAPEASLMLLLTGWTFLWGLLNVALLGPIIPSSVVYFVAVGMSLGAWRTRQSQTAAGNESPLPRIRRHNLALETAR